MSKKKETIKRSIVIKHQDGDDVELVLSKVTAVKTTAEMIHFDKLSDGTWRLIYNPNLIPEISDVLSFDIVREG